MEALGLQAGINTVHAHNRIRESLRHCIEERGQFSSRWMAKETRETFKQPIPALLQIVLKGIVPELEEEREKVA